MNIVGHRGASGTEPENTPAAFEAADRMGADGVELDVRLAADGHGGSRLVVFHDPLPVEQAALDVLPGFDEVLDACGARMLVNVEIKNSDADGGYDPTMASVAPTIAAMRRRGPSWTDRWLISAFTMSTIDHCRRIAPEIPTAFLVYEPSDAAIDATVRHGHVAIHPWAQMLDAGRVAACHDAGLSVNTWTCNDPAQIRDFVEWGVDGVCTDVPDVALRAAGRTGEGRLNPSWETRG
jgi:glycerophosphoryl diester phosphodiesterase